jgi:hypothetical protein
MSPDKSLRSLFWMSALMLMLLIGGCGGGRNIINRSNLYDVETLMPPLRVQSLVGQPPQAQLETESEGTQYLFYRYNIKVEPDDSAASGSMGSMTQYNSRMGTELSMPSTSSTTVVPYFLIFKERKLLFHGLLGDFQKSSITEIRLLHPRVDQWYQSTM